MIKSDLVKEYIVGSKNNKLKVKKETIIVKAHSFVNKINCIDDLNKKTVSIKDKLNQIRHSSNNADVSKLLEFKQMIDEPVFYTKKNDISTKPFPIFSQDDILKLFKKINLGKDYDCSDKFNNLSMNKVAGLQKYLNYEITGQIDYKFFNTILDNYLNFIFTGDIEKVHFLDPLIIDFSTSIKDGNISGYLKALIVIKTVIMAAERDLFGKFDKMKKILDDNLPTSIKVKFYERLDFLKRRRLAFLKQDINNGISLKEFVDKEINNMSLHDKINFLREAKNNNSFKYLDLFIISNILELIIGLNNKKDNELMLITYNYLIKTNSSNDQSLKNTIKKIGNKLKANAMVNK